VLAGDIGGVAAANSFATFATFATNVASRARAREKMYFLWYKGKLDIFRY
jgi:hypothetical protein